MIPADLIAALIAVLKADPQVAALAATRVFGVELPGSEAAAMPRKCLVLQPSGGATLVEGSYVEHTAQRLDLFAYGETPYQASRLSRAAAIALKQVRRRVAAQTLIHWVDPAGGYLTGRDPDADWPVVFQSFQAFYAETEIAA